MSCRYLNDVFKKMISFNIQIHKYLKTNVKHLNVLVHRKITMYFSSK